MSGGLLVVLLIAIVCCFGAYIALRNITIAKKGVDVEGFLSYLISIPAFCLVVMGLSSISMKEDVPSGFMALIGGIVLIALNVLRFAKKIGIGSAVGICILQSIGLGALVIYKVVAFCAGMLSGSMRQGDKVNRDISKQRAWEKYQRAKSDANQVYAYDKEAAARMESRAEQTYKDESSMIDTIYGKDNKK